MNATLAMINIDCADPAELAAFYAAVLGWKVTYSDADYGMITDGSATVGFGRLDGYRAPGWPNSEGGKQFHLDLHVDDVPEAVARCVELGAVKPEFQPGETWTVMLDPAGHPFCLCVRPSDGQ